MSSLEQEAGLQQQQQQNEKIVEPEKLCSGLEPTLNVAWGPLWYPGHTLHETSSSMDTPVVICNHQDNDDNNVLIKATSIWTRFAMKPTNGIVFQLRGRVLDATTCQR